MSRATAAGHRWLREHKLIAMGPDGYYHPTPEGFDIVDAMRELGELAEVDRPSAPRGQRRGGRLARDAPVSAPPSSQASRTGDTAGETAQPERLPPEEAKNGP